MHGDDWTSHSMTESKLYIMRTRRDHHNMEHNPTPHSSHAALLSAGDAQAMFASASAQILLVTLRMMNSTAGARRSLRRPYVVC